MATNNNNTTDLFTREGARSASPDQVKVMVASVKRKVSTLNRNDRDLRIAAAYTTFALARQYRAEGKEFKVSDVAKMFGTARANVYLWLRLGVAVVEFGIEPGSDEWSALMDTANRVPMSWALDGFNFDTITMSPDGKPQILTKGDDAFVGYRKENFDKAWSLLYPDGLRDDDGKAAKPLTTDKVSASMLGEYGTTENKEQAAKEQAEARWKRFRENVKFLTDNAKYVTADQWRQIDKEFQALHSALLTNRRAKFEAPAKKTAAKKTAAKKTTAKKTTAA